MASDAWNHFTIDTVDSNYAKCNICNKLLSRGGESKSTSNLKNHLKNVHKINSSSSSLQKKTTAVSEKTSATLAAFFSRPSKSQTLPTTQSAVPSTSTDIRPWFSNPHEEHGRSSDLEDDPSPIPTDVPLTLEIPETIVSDSRSSASESLDASLPLSSSSTGVTSPRYPKTLKLKKTGSQLTLPQVTDRMTKFKSNDNRAVTINKLIAKMMCKDLQPISFVENEGFRELISHLEPRYTIPSRKTFGKKILIQMYEEEVNMLRGELMDVQFVAVTTDMWTSIANTDFMSVSVHFFNENENKLKHKCLEVKPFSEVSHTAGHLRDFLRNILLEWNISDKVVAVVRDNGADITAAIERSEYEAIPCLAHTLQLVLKDGFLDTLRITNVVKKCKKIVGSFKHSAKNTKVLKAVQKQLGLPLHAMVQDEPTRWNTTYHMLKRILEQKEAIILISAKNEIRLAAELTSDDWNNIEFAVDILEIFETATLQVSKESSTIAEVSKSYCSIIC